jgi:hypothetical protein
VEGDAKRGALKRDTAALFNNLHFPLCPASP